MVVCLLFAFCFVMSQSIFVGDECDPGGFCSHRKFHLNFLFVLIVCIYNSFPIFSIQLQNCWTNERKRGSVLDNKRTDWLNWFSSQDWLNWIAEKKRKNFWKERKKKTKKKEQNLNEREVKLKLTVLCFFFLISISFSTREYVKRESLFICGVLIGKVYLN